MTVDAYFRHCQRVFRQLSAVGNSRSRWLSEGSRPRPGRPPANPRLALLETSEMCQSRGTCVTLLPWSYLERTTHKKRSRNAPATDLFRSCIRTCEHKWSNRFDGFDQNLNWEAGVRMKSDTGRKLSPTC
jgi:hypothetical protein